MTGKDVTRLTLIKCESIQFGLGNGFHDDRSNIHTRKFQVIQTHRHSESPYNQARRRRLRRRQRRSRIISLNVYVVTRIWYIEWNGVFAPLPVRIHHVQSFLTNMFLPGFGPLYLAIVVYIKKKKNQFYIHIWNVSIWY